MHQIFSSLGAAQTFKKTYPPARCNVANILFSVKLLAVMAKGLSFHHKMLLTNVITQIALKYDAAKLVYRN